MKKDAVQKLWEQIETFAAYGFGKAHAASYGNLAYKTAYMRLIFPSTTWRRYSQPMLRRRGKDRGGRRGVQAHGYRGLAAVGE